MREPFIIKWPGVVKGGSTTDSLAIGTDFYPTILEMAGLPPRPDQHLDGVSLVPVLKNTGLAELLCAVGFLVGAMLDRPL